MTDWDILINTDSVNIFVIMYEMMNFLLHMQGTMIKKITLILWRTNKDFPLKVFRLHTLDFNWDILVIREIPSKFGRPHTSYDA